MGRACHFLYYWVLCSTFSCVYLCPQEGAGPEAHYWKNNANQCKKKKRRLKKRTPMTARPSLELVVRKLEDIRSTSGECLIDTTSAKISIRHRQWDPTLISSFSAGFKPCISATTSLYFTFLDTHFKTILKRYFDATTCNVLLLLLLSSVWKCHALRQHSANGLEAWSTHCHHYICCEDGADDFRSSLHAFYVDSIVSSSMCQLCYPEVFLCGFQQMFADLEPSLVGLVFVSTTGRSGGKFILCETV